MPTDGTLIPTTFNSRDAGGRPARSGFIRSGLLLRSDAPVRVDESGLDALRTLAIRTAIDLREPVERDLDPVELNGVKTPQIPILGPHFDAARDMSLQDVYFQILERRGAALTDAVRALCQADALPALVFCSAGKDRTGLVIALTLGALGASPAEIVADYTLTERAMERGFRAVIERRAIAAGISEQELAVKVGAPPELMVSVLDWLRDHYGGPAPYLLRHGMTEDELEHLRLTMVEPRAVSAA